MPAPDFNKNTIDTLAKRASFKCSNPDCRVATIGPNADPSKSTLIGEAAHILGARQNSKRYVQHMTDVARAEITNGIWLCRNCHKLVDTDENRYTSDVLYSWREEHEKFVFSELGNKSDRIQFDRQNELLANFEGYPPLIRRVVIDKPKGWEWRLAAELMRYLNAPYFRKIRDLRGGYYFQAREHIEEENILTWIGQRLEESSRVISPVEKLFERLTLSFGEPGEPGDIREIHHVCGLIRDYIGEVINYEEKLYFAIVPEDALGAVELLKNCLSSQVEKLEAIPGVLDGAVSLIDREDEFTGQKPKVIQKTITFELPPGWERKMERELKKLNGSAADVTSFGCTSMIIMVFLIFIVMAIF